MNVWIVLRADARGSLNRLRRHRGRMVALLLVTLLGIVPLLGLTLTGGIALARFLPSPLLDPVLSLGFAGASSFMVLVTTPAAISSFFTDRALLLLASSPLRSRSLFLARLATAAWGNTLIAVFLFCLLLGVALGSGRPALVVPAALLTLAALVLSATAIQVVILSGLLRLLPTRMVRDAAVFMSTLLGVALYSAQLSIRTLVLPSQTARRASLSSIVALIHDRVSAWGWLPVTWPGHAIGELARGSPETGLAWLIAYTALALVVVVVAEVAYRQSLFAGIGVYGAGGPVRSSRRRSVSARPQTSRGIASTTWTLVHKDLLVMRRDSRRLARAIPGLAMALVYGVLFTRRGPGSQLGIASGTFVILFVTFMASSMVALPALPSEGRQILLLRSSPVSPARLLWAKIVFAAIPVAPIVALVAVIVQVEQGAGVTTVLGTAVLAAILAFGAVAIEVCAGAFAANFETDDPRRAVRIEGSAVGCAAMVAYLACTSGGFALTAGSLNAAHPSPIFVGLGFILMLVGVCIPALALVLARGQANQWQVGP